MDSNDIFEDFMTAPSALKDIAEDAVNFYWQERHQENHTLLHRVFMLNEFCTTLEEVFRGTSDEEIEIPDDFDLDLIDEVIPEIIASYGNHVQGGYVRTCVEALRDLEGQRVLPDFLLQRLPLVNQGA